MCGVRKNPFKSRRNIQIKGDCISSKLKPKGNESSAFNNPFVDDMKN